MDAESIRIDEAVLALLWLNLDATGMAWKGFAWDVMGRLHQRGLISNPVSKTKAEHLTAEGLAVGKHLFHELFTQPRAPSG